ncbi:hypothetical protein COU61_01385 [Candidatus Pacearchaeota archaeon CG10_big_fil_rev_8_21_14_0_10_35_13]|nr:MAG: hypothetical protein COU61_01385 [Candidatus Pacearchaeota archaeon CG10_big_fil_rev_8_21_14_0_10_35_13]
MASYEVIGSIAVMKFPEEEKISIKEKKKVAEKLLEKNNVKTVVEKIGRIKGRLRTLKTKHLAGIKTLTTIHKENGCLMKVNIETCYFSPRLSEERKRIMKECKNNEKVLVMFGGVAPYAIVIAKNKKEVKEVVSVEIGKECSKYAQENVRMNKQEKKVRIIQGDVKKIIPRLKEKGEKYDRIIMTRPNLKETFIKYALMVAKKGGMIHYHGFSHEEDKEEMVKELLEEINNERRKVKVLKVMKVGDIAPRKYRWRIDMKILN